MDTLNRKYSVAEVSLSNVCNFSCDYCISKSPNYKITKNLDGSVKIYTDPRINKNGVVDLQLARKYGLSMGMMSPADHDRMLSENNLGHSRDDFIDFDALIRFARTKLIGWVIQITGGEPLMVPQVTDFLIELSKSHRILLLTNLSKLSKNLNILEIPSERIFFRVGFHPERYPVDRYLDNFRLLDEANIPYIVNYVLHPRHIENTMGKAYIDFLRDNNIPFEVTRFYGYWGGVKYPLVELGSIERELVSPHNIENNYTRDIDTPGTTYIAIQPNGKIYQCSASGRYLGSIYHGNLLFGNRISLPSCFSKMNKCPSVVAQEHIFHDIGWGDDINH